jgi:hypothetical protein
VLLLLRGTREAGHIRAKGLVSEWLELGVKVSTQRDGGPAWNQGSRTHPGWKGLPVVGLGAGGQGHCRGALSQK